MPRPEIEKAKATFLDADGEPIREGQAIGGNSAYIFRGNGVGEIDVQLLNAPNDAQTINYSLDFTESARQWRFAADAFRSAFRLIFPSPRCGKSRRSLNARPPWLLSRRATPNSRRVGKCSNRITPMIHKCGYGYAIWRPRKTAKSGRSKARPCPKTDGQTRNLFQSTQGWSSVFHSDNSLAGTDETALGFSLYRPENLGETADITLTAQRALTLLKTHVLPLVPLPKRNDVVEFEPKQVFDGVWHLRRIVWIDDEQLKGDLRFSGGAALLLTFDMAPGAYLDQDDMQLERDVFYDEKGTVE